MNKISLLFSARLGWRPPSRPGLVVPAAVLLHAVVCRLSAPCRAAVICRLFALSLCPLSPWGVGGSAFGSGAFARLVWWSPPALRAPGRVRCSLRAARAALSLRGAVGRCGRPLRLRGLWLRAPAPPLGRGACWRSGGAVPRPSGGVSCALRCGRPLRSGGFAAPVAPLRCGRRFAALPALLRVPARSAPARQRLLGGRYASLAGGGGAGVVSGGCRLAAACRSCCARWACRSAACMM